MKVLIVISSLLFAFQTMAQEVDSQKSEFKWLATKVTGKHFGKIPLKNAKLTLDKKTKVTGGEFILDLTQITVDDLEGEWQQKFLKHIKSKDFFEVSKWPTVKLVISKLDGKHAHGQLTIRDKTHPIKIKYTQKGKKYSGKIKFDRTKYGMVYGSGDFFKNLGDKMIHNEVTVDFVVQLK